MPSTLDILLKTYNYRSTTNLKSHSLPSLPVNIIVLFNPFKPCSKHSVRKLSEGQVAISMGSML